MKDMSRRVKIVLFIIMIIIMMIGCTSRSESDQEIISGPETESSGDVPALNQILKVGVIMPMSGKNAENGKMNTTAIELAANEINTMGGIGGRIPIKIYIEDEEATPSKAATVAQKLLYEDKVDIIIGANSSPCTLVVMELTEAAKVPQLAPSSTSLSVTQQGNEWICRTAVPDTITMRTVMDYCQSSGYKSVAVIHNSADFGMQAKEAAEKECKRRGITITKDVTYTEGDTDYSTNLMMVKDSQPEAIILWTNVADGSRILAQRIQYDMGDIPLLGYGFNYPEQMLELAGSKALDGVMIASAFTMVGMDKRPSLKAFVEDFNKVYGGNPSQNAANCYDTMKLLADAVERFGVEKPLDRQGIRDALRASNFTGMNGTYKFDETGEIIKDLYILKFDGQAKHSLVEW